MFRQSERPPDGSEDLVRRQAEWDRKVESLDQQQAQLFEGQWKLIREQTGALTVELAQMRVEVALMKKDALSSKSFEEAHGTLKERLSYLEDLLGDSAEKHEKHMRDMEAHRIAHSKLANELKAREETHASVTDRLDSFEKFIKGSVEGHAAELASGQAKMEQMQVRIAGCEKYGSMLTDLKKAQADFVKQKASLEADHAVVKQHLGSLEGWVGDSADKHAKALHEMHARTVSCERQGTAMAELLKAHSSLADEKDALHSHHFTLKEHVEYIEKLLGDSVEKHAKELEAIKTAHAKFASDAKANHGKFSDLLAQEKGTWADHHATMQERLNYLEGLLGDSADKHEKALEAHRSAHSKLASDVRARDEHHATLTERIGQLEQLVGAKTDHHAQELEHLKGCHVKLAGLAGDAADKHTKALQEMHGRVTACERHGSAVEGLKKAHEGLAHDQAALHNHHFTLKEHVEYIENVFGGAVEKHTKELDGIKAAHAKFASEAKAHHGKVQYLIAQEQGVRAEHHASVVERLVDVEGLLGDSADKHERALEAHRASHAKLAGEVRAREEHHASLAERLEDIEKASAQHAGDLEELQLGQGKAATVAKDAGDQCAKAFQELHARMASCERLGASVAALQKDLGALRSEVADVAGECAVMNQEHATLQEHVDYSDKTVVDSLEKHAKEMDAMKASQAKMSAETKCNSLKFMDLVAQEKDARKEDSATTQDRLRYIEGLLADTADKHDKHAKVLDAHRAAQSKLASDMNARELSHASITERLDSLEKITGASLERHDAELIVATSKLDLMHVRILGCEKYGAIFGEVKKASADIANDRVGFDAQHAALKERVDELEGTANASSQTHLSVVQDMLRLGETTDRLMRDLETMKGTHATLVNGTHAMEADQQKLRFKMEDLQGKFKAERDAGDQHHNAIQGRCDAVDNAVVGLSEGLERTIREAADTQERLREALGALAGERAARETLQDSFEVRTADAESLFERVAEERQGLAADIKDLRDRLGNTECLARHEHIQSLQQMIADERDNVRITMDELLAREKVDRGTLHRTLNTRVDSLERTVGFLDELSRKERDQRMGENNRLWDAIDSHTHDLSASVENTSIGASSPARELAESVSEVAEVIAPPRIVRPTATIAESEVAEVIAPPRIVRPTATIAEVKVPLAAPTVLYSMAGKSMKPQTLQATIPMLTSSTRSLPTRSTRALLTSFTGLPCAPRASGSAAMRQRSGGGLSRSPERSSVETITCGSTRYGNEVRQSACVIQEPGARVGGY